MQSPCIILLRHAERLDRSLESRGEDWISTAHRPQDSPISPFGTKQATETGVHFKDRFNIQKVLASPLVRTVQTADIICRELCLGSNTICVEQGLVEEAKSLRGKTEEEPKPNWHPLLLSAHELIDYSDKINLSYQSLVSVRHERDDSVMNTVREVHDTLTDKDDITRDRCYQLITQLKESISTDDTVLCVGHGASTGGCALALQSGLPSDLYIEGERTVCSFAVFVPHDPCNLQGPWYAPSKRWENVLAADGSCENTADQGGITA